MNPENWPANIHGRARRLWPQLVPSAAWLIACALSAAAGAAIALHFHTPPPRYSLIPLSETLFMYRLDNYTGEIRAIGIAKDSKAIDRLVIPGDTPK
jgi:hypothetical protein